MFLLKQLWQRGGNNGCSGYAGASGGVKMPRLTGGDVAPGVTGASFTTPRSRFFRQPRSSRVNKQMLVFYSLVRSGERGKTYPRVAGRNGVSTHVTHSASLFLPFLGAGGVKTGKKCTGGEMAACLCFGCWLQGVFCVCVFLCNYLSEELFEF